MPDTGLAAYLDRAFAVRLMQHMVVPTFVLDADRKVLIWNKACERLTAVRAGELIGTTEHWRAFYDKPRHCLADLVALGRTEEVSAHYAEHWLPGEDAQGVRAENWCVMPRAKKRLYLAIDAGPIFDDDGQVIAVVETLRDMTEAERTKTQLQSLANKDGLTQLANRRAFDNFLRTRCQYASRDHEPLALILADVDHFKAYNDNYGHPKGDSCLRQVAKVLNDNLFRPIDLAARYGGEEFAFVLPASDLSGALSVAERLRKAVDDLTIEHGFSSCADHVTMSFGVAACEPGPETEPEDVIAAADKALYKAKGAGRNRVVGTDRIE